MTVGNQTTEWESDTIIGENPSGVLVTHVDKASKFLVAALGKDKSVKELNKVTINLFKEIDKNRDKPSPVIMEEN